MDVMALGIPVVKLIKASRFEDHRGFYSQIYTKQLLEEHGIAHEFVQDGWSLSRARGTLRGLHFQIPPMAQAKLVTVLSGRVLDVAVDCRRGSCTYGQHVAVELASDASHQLFIPAGFAHGFCTLEPDTIMFYKFSVPFKQELDSGIVWNDPDLAISWPVSAEAAVLSAKDKGLMRFRDLPPYFDNAAGGGH